MHALSSARANSFWSGGVGFLQGLVLGSGDDLGLHVRIEVDEVVGVTGHSDEEIGVVFRVGLGVAQGVGADDVDGTVVEEKIYHEAGATTPQEVLRADLVRWIEDAGRIPVERDTLYRPVDRSKMPPPSTRPDTTLSIAASINASINE